MSDVDQSQALEIDLVAEPATSSFISEHYDVLQRSILAGMGLDSFSPELATRIMSAIQNPSVPMQLWRIYSPDDQSVAGTITFYTGQDALTQEKFLWIYSMHLSAGVPLEAWRRAFVRLDSYAKSIGVSVVSARTKLDRVVDIAMDNGFDVLYYLERRS